MSLIVRPPRPGEEPAIRAMIVEILADYRLEYCPNPEDRDLDDLPAAYHAPGERFIVLEETSTGHLMGCGGIKRLSDEEIELRKLYLQPAIRGQGWGTRLMGEFIALARRHGYRRMVLETSSRLPEAARLYEKLGFTAGPNPHPHAKCDVRYVLDL